MIHLSPYTVLLIMAGLVFVGALIWAYDLGFIRIKEGDDAE